MSKYKGVLPAVNCSYREWAAFCNNNGCREFLFLSCDEATNKKLDKLTKKYPELWLIACQRTSEDEYLNRYRQEWLKKSINHTLGYLVMAVYIGIVAIELLK